MIYQIPLSSRQNAEAGYLLRFPGILLPNLSLEQAWILKKIHADAVFSIKEYSTKQKECWTDISVERLLEISGEAFNFYLLTLETEIIGFASVSKPGYLWHLYIAPRYHYCGYGSLLLKHIENNEENRDFSNNIRLAANLGAVDFYLRHGYEKTGSAEIQFGKETISVINMKKCF